MTKYCPNCGSDVESTNKLKYCPECGQKLESNYKFCPICGYKITTEVTKQVKIKKEDKPKKEKISIKIPKISFKLSRNLMIVIVVVCIGAIIAGSIYVMHPFSGSITNSKNRTFTITIKNDLDHKINCAIKFGQLKQISDFEMQAGEEDNFEIYEKDIFIKSDSYEITCIATYEETQYLATAVNITEFVDFEISDTNGPITVEVTDSL